MADTLTDVPVPSHYAAVADIDTGFGLQITQFMVGYTSLQDVADASRSGTLADIGFENFDG
jgi:hypothetical protein